MINLDTSDMGKYSRIEWDLRSRTSHIERARHLWFRYKKRIDKVRRLTKKPVEPPCSLIINGTPENKVILHLDILKIQIW